jgi:hypothetical protein
LGWLDGFNPANMNSREATDLKWLRWLCIAGLLLQIMIGVTACGGSETSGDEQQWPEPTAGAPFFILGEDASLPQTLSAPQLSEYLASEHFESDLDGWFFFGSLVDSAAPEDPGVFFISMQRIEVSDGGSREALVPAIVAFNSASLGQYVFGGEYTQDVSPAVNVESDPWSVEINPSDRTEPPLMTMGLASGSMGVAGAEYRLTADVPDQLGGRLQAEVLLRDNFGVVNQGYGSASFFPQFLTEPQKEQVTGSFGNSVQDYLETTGDPMSSQGSYYYSLPLLDVEQFTITRDGALLSSGTSGTMWMDDVVQSYDEQATKVLIDGDASWEFFSIMLPEANAAIMVIQITSATGTLPVATLFRDDSDRTLNGARKALHSWNMDEIDIEAVSGTTWVSPGTGLQYAQQHRIRLGSDAWLADLTITMVRENQEIVYESTIKYEGLATVEGTLGDQQVKGTAFVELQPVGHL